MDMVQIITTALITAAIVGGVLGWQIIQQRRLLAEIEQVANAAVKSDWSERCRLIHPATNALDTLLENTARRVHHLDRRSGDLQALVDALPDPLLLADTRGKVILFNTPAARLLRIERQEALGMPLTGVVSDRAILSLFDDFEAAHQTTPMARDLRLLRDGQRLSFHSVTTRTEAGGVLVVLRNMTQIAATAQMKTDFVANASHELRTPIAAIKIAFETLNEVVDEDPQQVKRCMAIIQDHLRRLEELLQDLLDLSRVEQQDLRPKFAATPVRELMYSVHSTLAAIAQKKDVTLDLDSADGPQEVVTDRRLLDLVLKNLMENSVKYTPAGGTVRARFETVTDNGPAVKLTVADTGIGIPREHQDRVFERFYQVEAARTGAAGRGTGLGLAIVKHAVNALGGSIKISGDVGEGTTITVMLPQKNAAAKSE